MFYVALGAIVGGRIGYMFIYGLSELIADPLSIFKVWQGGMSFHGGFVGVLVAMWLYAPRDQASRSSSSRTSSRRGRRSASFAGRIGNFINGELWGKPTSPDAPWAVIVDGQARHASQLYEAVPRRRRAVRRAVALYAGSRGPRWRRPACSSSSTASGRFLVEFVREPDQQIGYLALGWVTMGQVLSAPMIIAGVMLFVLAHRRGTEA